MIIVINISLTCKKTCYYVGGGVANINFLDDIVDQQRDKDETTAIYELLASGPLTNFNSKIFADFISERKASTS